ncbi:MAG: hypothetical protein QM765_40950 [Myxococcales bacterium]
MSRTNRWLFMTSIALALTAAGCGGYQHPLEDVPGIEELSQPLTALATPPTWTAGTSTLAVTIAAAETAVVSKHPVSGNILVNDVITAGANSTTVKKITVTSTGANATLIMDFANGTFAPGTASSPGILVDWGATAGVKTFKLRGSSTGADLITAGLKSSGEHQIGFSSDALADIQFALAPSEQTDGPYVFSLGGGADIFAADTTNAVKYLGTGATAMTAACTVFGGPGNDTFTGGTGADLFWGDENDDTFKAGAAAVAGTKTFHGGAGVDTADYSSRAATEALTFEPDSTGTASSGCLACGAAETHKLYDDVEVLKGGAGDDKFLPNVNEGHTFLGGAGTDLADYSAAGLGAVTVTMGDSTANDGFVHAPASGIPMDNIGNDVENLKCAAASACTVTGNTMDNTFFVIAATAAAHAFTGLTGVDTIDFTAFGATLDVKMDNTASTTAGIKINTDVENLKCPTLNTASCTVLGNDLANHLWGVNSGGAGVNSLTGGNGDDTIEGAEAGDTVVCGSGSDIYVGTLARPADCEL